MKIRHIVFSLLPAIAVADNATTVPDDEPWHPPLPEELLHPQKGNAALPATAQPIVSYKVPKNEEQTWLKLLFVKDSETWPEVFRRMASASREKDMQMCHGYALWMKGLSPLHLRYDDDLSLSGIHADGHAYGVLFVEFNPYGVRVCPMQGYDLTGRNGGVCWQNAATQLWSWADAEKFWTELPKLLKADTKTGATSAQDTAVKREVATKGQRMVVFWAPEGYPAKAWWSAFQRLHEAVGPHRFSLITVDGLNLWTDVAVPSVKPAAKSAEKPAATGSVPAAPAVTAANPAAPPTPITAAPPLHAPASVRAAAEAPSAATPAPAAGASPAAGAATPAPPAAAPAAERSSRASTRTRATAAAAAPAPSTAGTTATLPAAPARTAAATAPTAAPPSPATPPAPPTRALDAVPTQLP